jgi:flagellar biosynthesis/type III secretory pathway M-ring protein FliF/YscJ
MDTLFVGWILGYLAVIAIGFLLLFLVVRAAILSALAKDRERVRREGSASESARRAAGP